jgi:hypothetical protein
LIPPSHLKEQIKNISEERLSVCAKCSYQSDNRKATGRYESVRPDLHCTNCGCTLSAKTACLSCKCPIDKWEAVLGEEEFDEIHKELGND